MFQIILFQPEIPSNTGNIVRLCANVGANLHLVRPLGFRLDDRALARAGMDYRELADVSVHLNWEACVEALGERPLFLLTTRGSVLYDQPRYPADAGFVFGPETTGLPQSLLDQHAAERHVRIPMATAARSLNLANSAAVVLYEAWRQNGFRGGV